MGDTTVSIHAARRHYRRHKTPRSRTRAGCHRGHPEVIVRADVASDQAARVQDARAGVVAALRPLDRFLRHEPPGELTRLPRPAALRAPRIERPRPMPTPTINRVPRSRVRPRSETLPRRPPAPRLLQVRHRRPVTTPMRRPQIPAPGLVAVVVVEIPLLKRRDRLMAAGTERPAGLHIPRILRSHAAMRPPILPLRLSRHLPPHQIGGRNRTGRGVRGARGW